MDTRIPMTDAQRLRDLAYHRVSDEVAHRMALLRGHYYAMGLRLLAELPDSHERSLALTALEDSSMRAIQCLAVAHGDPMPPTLPTPQEE